MLYAKWLKHLNYSVRHLNYSVSCDLSAAPGPTGSVRQLSWTAISQRPVCVGPYRVSIGLCRCLTIDIDRHRPLETRYKPALDWCRSKQVGAGPVPVWIGRCRCRSESVGAGAGLGRKSKIIKKYRNFLIEISIYRISLKPNSINNIDIFFYFEISNNTVGRPNFTPCPYRTVPLRFSCTVLTV